MQIEKAKYNINNKNRKEKRPPKILITKPPVPKLNKPLLLFVLLFIALGSYPIIP